MLHTMMGWSMLRRNLDKYIQGWHSAACCMLQAQTTAACVPCFLSALPWPAINHDTRLEQLCVR